MTAVRSFITFAAFSLVASASLDAQTSVRMSRAGYRLSQKGERVTLGARVVDRTGRDLPGARINWRSSDPSVVTVGPDGTATAQRDGVATIWAVSGRDSSSAVILVEARPTGFTFTPRAIDLDAIGAQGVLRVDARGVALSAARALAACRVRDTEIASLGTSGRVTGSGNGVTWIKCSDGGLTDSVRVEVRQRPVRATVSADGVVALGFIGDSARLAMIGYDRLGGAVAGVRPTWLSLDPSIARADSATGTVRGLSAGTARVVARLGSITDTVSVIVPTTTQSEVAASLRAATTAPLAPGSVIPRANPIDVATATPATPAPQRVRPTGTSTSGAATPVGGAALPGGAPSTVTRSPSSSGTTGTSGGRRAPAGDAGAAAAANGQSTTRSAAADSILKSIVDRSTVSMSQSRRWVRAGFIGVRAANRVDIGDGAEEASGMLIGGEAVIAPFSWLNLRAHMVTGTLSANAPGVEDRKAAEADGVIGIPVLPWLSLDIGATARGFQTTVASQRWIMARTGVSSRMDFVGGSVSSIVRFAFMPMVKVNGLESPDLSLSASAGLEYRVKRLRAGVEYGVDRFDFPVSAGTQRMEQMSRLSLTVGLNVLQ